MTNTEKSVSFAQPENNSPVNKLGYDIVVNILMLGDEEVGKGSVVRRYTEGYFPINENLYNINIECKKRDIIGWGGTGYNGTKPIVARLQIWNFHMHRIGDGPMVQHYLDSNGFLLFFDVTSKTSFLQLPLLIDMVRTKCKGGGGGSENANSLNSNSSKNGDATNGSSSSNGQSQQELLPPIVIVGNKCDDVENTVVDPVAAKKYCDSLNIPLLFISAKTNENVELAFNTLQNLIVKHNKAVEREKLRQLKLQKQQQSQSTKKQRENKKVNKDVPCSIM